MYIHKNLAKKCWNASSISRVTVFRYFFERKIACLISECQVKRRDILLFELSCIFIYILRKCLVVHFARNHARNVIRIVHGMNVKGIKFMTRVCTHTHTRTHARARARARIQHAEKTQVVVGLMVF